MLITVLHFTIRLPRVSLVPKGIDAMYHLLCASKFQRGRPPITLGRFVVGDEYTHPPLLHILLSLFNERFRAKALFLIGLVSDYVLSLVVYFVALQFVPVPFALTAALIYCITPASFLSSVSESARPLGSLWYGLTILLLSTQNLFWMICAIVTTALTLMSHKMATQTLLFTCLLISPILFTVNPLFPLPLILGLSLALLATRGSYLDILRDHIGIIRFHMKYGSWNRRRKLPGSPVQLVKMQPYFFLPLLGLLLNPEAFLSGSIFMLAWYASVLIVFFAWVWGDADRYLSYSAMPVAFLSAIALSIGTNLVFLVPPIIVSSALIYRNSQVFYKRENLPDFSKIETTEESVTLVVPSSLTYISALNMKGRILCGGSNATGLRFELETFPKLMSTNPDRFLAEYPVSHLLLGPKHHDFVKPIEANFEPVQATNGYILFKRKKITENS